MNRDAGIADVELARIAVGGVARSMRGYSSRLTSSDFGHVLLHPLDARQRGIEIGDVVDARRRRRGIVGEAKAPACSARPAAMCSRAASSCAGSLS